MLMGSRESSFPCLLEGYKSHQTYFLGILWEINVMGQMTSKFQYKNLHYDNSLWFQLKDGGI
jgi:hypothetical protein